MDPTPISLKIQDYSSNRGRLIFFSKSFEFLSLSRILSLFSFILFDAQFTTFTSRKIHFVTRNVENNLRFHLQKEPNCRFRYYAITFCALSRLFWLCFSSFSITTRLFLLSSFFLSIVTLSDWSIVALSDATAINYSDFESLCAPIKTDTDLG